jgi:uncharacterized membrane protein HdeD (DUF308 family)
MSTDNHTSGGPAGDQERRASASDPAYQGAKPATFADTAESWSFFGFSGRFAANHAMSAALARNWWVILLRGIFAILFGLAAILLPGVTLAVLVLIFAAYMLLDGIFDIVAAVRAAQRHERWGLLIVEGIVDLAAGVIALVWPLITILVFVYIMGAWAIVSGILLWSAAFRLNLTHGRWLMGFGGAVSTLWGFLLLLWPFSGAVAVTWLIGVYALFFGGAMLALAFRLRRLRHEIPPSGAIPQRA